jgi:hypothetical protein
VPRRKLVTADVINRIQSWVDAGLRPTAIAEKIGCTLGTLRVRCSQLRISLRRKTHVARRGRDGEVQSRRGIPVAEAKTARPSEEMTDHIEQDEHVALWMSRPILRELRRRAAQKGISTAALATILLRTIVEDDLYEAVLDLDETSSGSLGAFPDG